MGESSTSVTIACLGCDAGGTSTLIHAILNHPGLLPTGPAGASAVVTEVHSSDQEEESITIYYLSRTDALRRVSCEIRRYRVAFREILGRDGSNRQCATSVLQEESSLAMEAAVEAAIGWFHERASGGNGNQSRACPERIAAACAAELESFVAALDEHRADCGQVVTLPLADRDMLGITEPKRIGAHLLMERAVIRVRNAHLQDQRWRFIDIPGTSVDQTDSSEERAAQILAAADKILLVMPPDGCSIRALSTILFSLYAIDPNVPSRLAFIVNRLDQWEHGPGTSVVALAGMFGGELMQEAANYGFGDAGWFATVAVFDRLYRNPSNAEAATMLQDRIAELGDDQSPWCALARQAWSGQGVERLRTWLSKD